MIRYNQKITVYISEDQKTWVESLPKSFNISEKMREYLQSLKDWQDSQNKNLQNTQKENDQIGNIIKEGIREIDMDESQIEMLIKAAEQSYDIQVDKINELGSKLDNISKVCILHFLNKKMLELTEELLEKLEIKKVVVNEVTYISNIE